MSAKIIETIEKEQFKEGRTGFGVGDKIKVFTKVKEGDKERTQLFAGTVIARKGRGLNEQFTVRRISYGEGVERIFPLHSPRIEKVEVETREILVGLNFSIFAVAPIWLCGKWLKPERKNRFHRSGNQRRRSRVVPQRWGWMRQVGVLWLDPL